jgi:hypothetical protein
MSELPDHTVLTGDDAARIDERVPYPYLPTKPERDNEISLEINGSVYLVPVYTPFVFDFDDEDQSLENAPIRVLLDSTGDNIIAWCLDSFRYVSYTHDEFIDGLTDGPKRLVIE